MYFVVLLSEHETVGNCRFYEQRPALDPEPSYGGMVVLQAFAGAPMFLQTQFGRMAPLEVLVPVPRQLFSHLHVLP